jgi:Single-strand binding protein family
MISSTPEYSRVYIKGTLISIDAQNDPRETLLQKQWVSFSVTISRRWQKRNGDITERMQTIPCIAFGKLSQMLLQAQMVLPFKVVIEGSFSARPVTGKLEVLADKIYCDEVIDAGYQDQTFDSFDE